MENSGAEVRGDRARRKMDEREAKGENFADDESEERRTKRQREG